MIKFTTINLCVVVIIATLIVCDRVQSMSSYNGGNRYQETSNAYGDDNYNSGSNGYDDASSDDVYNGEERPKIKVNIGLHIPAMKIQMPKRLLPKITVRAKVRQPNRPSVMYVPEIQIDKTDNLPGPEGSKPAATEGYNSNNYGSSSGYNTNNNNNYANQQAADQISTLSYQDGGFADSNYATNNNYHTSSSPQPDYYRQSASNGAYQQLPQQQGSYQQKYSQDNQYSGSVQQTRPVNNYSNQVNYQRPAPINYQSATTANYNQQGYNNLGQYKENLGANRYSARYN